MLFAADALADAFVGVTPTTSEVITAGVDEDAQHGYCQAAGGRTQEEGDADQKGRGGALGRSRGSGDEIVRVPSLDAGLRRSGV